MCVFTYLTRHGGKKIKQFKSKGVTRKRCLIYDLKKELYLNNSQYDNLSTKILKKNNADFTQ